MSPRPTVVTFPAGSVVGDSVISSVHASEAGAVVIVDATPFHPVDHTWPDQPGDAGAIRLGGESVAVVEADVPGDQAQGCHRRRRGSPATRARCAASIGA